MSPKTILFFCAQALLAQTAFSACAGSYAGYGLGGLGACNGLGGIGLAGGYGNGLAGGYGNGLAGGHGNGLAGGYGTGCGCGTGVASTGGGLPVSSVSPIAPVGVSVMSENAYEGTLSAGGNLPFLGTVAIEGVLPTAGEGAVSYGCGDGAIGVGSEGPIATGITIPGAVFPPSSPNSVATADALAMVGNGLGNGFTGYGRGGMAGYGLGAGAAGYGLGGGAGYGLGAGCGCGGRF